MSTHKRLMGSALRATSLAILTIGSFVGLQGCSGSAAPTAMAYSTLYGLGPDKWASAWLLTRVVSPGATLNVSPLDEEIARDGIPFDVPDSALKRERDHAAFSSIVQNFEISDPVVADLAKIITEIEVEFWNADDSLNSQIVESAFRNLQRTEGRMMVAPSCYVDFFQSVYDGLKKFGGGDGSLRHAALRSSCEDGRATTKAVVENPTIPEIPIRVLLSEMRNGKSVIFVDVREGEEFRQSHIPGAVNRQVYGVTRDNIKDLRNADYVVSYCVKDFRGYEMAKRLRGFGIANSVILKPFGIKGWVESGLPITGADQQANEKAMLRLKECIAMLGCMAKKDDA